MLATPGLLAGKTPDRFTSAPGQYSSNLTSCSVQYGTLPRTLKSKRESVNNQEESSVVRAVDIRRNGIEWTGMDRLALGDGM